MLPCRAATGGLHQVGLVRPLWGILFALLPPIAEDARPARPTVTGEEARGPRSPGRPRRIRRHYTELLDRVVPPRSGPGRQRVVQTCRVCPPGPARRPAALSRGRGRLTPARHRAAPWEENPGGRRWYLPSREAARRATSRQEEIRRFARCFRRRYPYSGVGSRRSCRRRLSPATMSSWRFAPRRPPCSVCSTRS